MTKKSDATQADQATAADATDIPLFTNDYLPAPPYGVYRKKVLTDATRIAGPFRVRTPHGEVECADGWLALDKSGEPYPIAADEFEELYELAPEGEVCDDEIQASRNWEIRRLADDFAQAILQNPAVERFVYGNPLEHHNAAEQPSVGAYLAHRCARLAEDYFRAAEALSDARMPQREPDLFADAEPAGTPE